MIRRLVIESPRYDGSFGSATRFLSREFPTVTVEISGDARDREGAALRIEEWSAPDAELSALDARVECSSADAVRLVAGEGGWPEAAEQILTRYQWLVSRRNAQSANGHFDELLAIHASLHDMEKPLVRADRIHALDTWQWTLRLDPSAGIAVQIAALFHDIERLVSEPDRRVEQHALDYRNFKRAHARGSANMLREVVGSTKTPSEVLERAARLVVTHEERGDDPDLRLLNDADALSFFSRNSDGFLRYYGEAHTRAKVRFTLGRLGRSARKRLARIRLRPEIARLIDEAPYSGGPG
ncbi:MAG: DUF4202 family protein [Polyangiaceae bacterium]|nr:DUF4202 family protein [Polyangiaceae bacterium]